MIYDLRMAAMRQCNRNAAMARTGSSMAQHVDLKTVVDDASGLVLSPSYLSGAIAYRLVCAAASLVAR